MSALTAIKEFCYLCSGENTAEVRRCTAPMCPLFPYRLGHNPPRERSAIEQAALNEKMANLREKARKK